MTDSESVQLSTSPDTKLDNSIEFEKLLTEKDDENVSETVSRESSRESSVKETTDGVEFTDDYIHCEECNKVYLEDCPKHGPLYHVEDTPVVNNKETDEEYAKGTVPACLRIAASAIKNSGLGVWATQTIPARSYFGPYRGVPLLHPTPNSYGWQLRISNRDKIWYIDASDSKYSNWMRYVNCARNFQEQNLIAYQFNGGIYYAVLREIAADTELYVFYNDDYANELGIDMAHYFDKPSHPLPTEKFVCDICDKTFKSPMQRDAHGTDCHPVRRSSRRSTNPMQNEAVKTYSCTRCDYKCDNFIEFECHKREHDSKKTFTCSDCGMKFIYLSVYRKHIRIHAKCTPENRDSGDASKPEDSPKGEGDNCPKENIESTSADNSKYQFFCDICSKKFQYIRAFKQHMRTHKRKNGTRFPAEISIKKEIISSDETNNEISTEATSVEHSETNEPEKPFICRLCGKKFATILQYRGHMAVHKRKKLTTKRPDKVKPDNPLPVEPVDGGRKELDGTWSCDSCGRKFQWLGWLRRHLQCHCSRTKLEPPDHITADADAMSLFPTDGFDCKSCSRSFGSFAELEEHALQCQSISEKIFPCELCEKAFSDPEDLSSHRQTHEDPLSYHCDVCNVTFEHATTFLVHQRSHSTLEKYRCGNCNVGFSRLDMLAAHSCFQDPPTKLYKELTERFDCPLCDASYKHRSNLRIHMRSHMGDEPHVCKICGKSFASAAYLQNHERKHGNDETFNCEQCGKRFAEKHHLTMHKRIHTEIDSLDCDVCHLKFSLPSLLKRHKLVHSGRATHQCHVCGKRFEYLSYLKRHQLVHANREDSIHAESQDPVDLEDLVDPVELLDPASEETSVFAGQEETRAVNGLENGAVNGLEVAEVKRLKAVDGGPLKPYGCDLCGRTFQLMAHLAKHRKSHDRSHTYSCSMCNETFTYFDDLREHRLSHQPIKQEHCTCDVCGKTFRFPWNLKNHKRVHEPKSPQTCEVCGKTYTDNARMQRHRLLHSEDTTKETIVERSAE